MARFKKKKQKPKNKTPQGERESRGGRVKRSWLLKCPGDSREGTLTTPAGVQPTAKGRLQGQITTRSPVPKHYRNSMVGLWGQAGKAEAPVTHPAQEAVTGPGEGPAARAGRQNGRPRPRARNVRSVNSR